MTDGQKSFEPGLLGLILIIKWVGGQENLRPHMVLKYFLEWGQLFCAFWGKNTS